MLLLLGFRAGTGQGARVRGAGVEHLSAVCWRGASYNTWNWQLHRRAQKLTRQKRRRLSELETASSGTLLVHHWLVPGLCLSGSCWRYLKSRQGNQQNQSSQVEFIKPSFNDSLERVDLVTGSRSSRSNKIRSVSEGTAKAANQQKRMTKTVETLVEMGWKGKIPRGSQCLHPSVKKRKNIMLKNSTNTALYSDTDMTSPCVKGMIPIRGIFMRGTYFAPGILSKRSIFLELMSGSGDERLRFTCALHAVVVQILAHYLFAMRLYS